MWKLVKIGLLLTLVMVSFETRAQSPVKGVATNFSTKNISATITTGGTFQSLLPTLASGVVRQSLTIQNNNATDNCWIFLGPLALATESTSILLLPGGSYTRYWPYVPSDAINVTCVSNGDTIYGDTN